MKKTMIFLSYLSKAESERMLTVLDFLLTGNLESRDRFLKIAKELYGEDNKLEYLSNNGRYPDCGWASYRDKRFTVIMRFERKYISEQGISVLGENDGDSFDWRYFYGIAIGKDDRKVYAISYSNRCSPNWNHEYIAQRYVELSDIPLLKEDGVIYCMDDSLHAAVNALLVENTPKFTEQDGMVTMTVKDQHGNYTDIKGTTVDEVFRDFTDNYTGYRNYRRQMASEWEIVDASARKRYEKWKETAKGLKSDFDKFYGGGIVD